AGAIPAPPLLAASRRRARWSRPLAAAAARDAEGLGRDELVDQARPERRADVRGPEQRVPARLHGSPRVERGRAPAAAGIVAGGEGARTAGEPRMPSRSRRTRYRPTR